MTEVDIVNRALAKNHVAERIISSDGTLANATSTGLATTLAKELYQPSRQQILRILPWTCLRSRKRLAMQPREAIRHYRLKELVVGSHDGIWSVYEATVAGISGSGTVTWPASGTVSDGEVTWNFLYNVKGDVLDEILNGFIYAFPLPDDFLAQVEIQNSFGKNIVSIIEGSYVFSDSQEPVLVYIPDSKDPDSWDSLLQEVIVTHTASALAFPLTGSHENEIAFAQAASSLIQQASASSLREHRQGQKEGSIWFPGLFDRGQP